MYNIFKALSVLNLLALIGSSYIIFSDGFDSSALEAASMALWVVGLYAMFRFSWQKRSSKPRLWFVVLATTAAVDLWELLPVGQYSTFELAVYALILLVIFLPLYYSIFKYARPNRDA